MKIASLIIAILGCAFIGLANAGSGKGVPTELTPLEKQEVKPQPVTAVVVPEKKEPKCRKISWSSALPSDPPQFLVGFTLPGCPSCCSVNVPTMLLPQHDSVVSYTQIEVCD